MFVIVKNMVEQSTPMGVIKKYNLAELMAVAGLFPGLVRMALMALLPDPIS
jgi:hypothetical protein